eukprot:8992550-Pyramimonas_sp.AAC.1
MFRPRAVPGVANLAMMAARRGIPGRRSHEAGAAATHLRVHMQCRCDVCVHVYSIRRPPCGATRL